MTRRRAFALGWIAVLALSAALPLSAIFHGLVHVGPKTLVLRDGVRRPVIAIGSDVVVQRGSNSLVVSILGNIRAAGDIRDDVVAVDGRVYLERSTYVHRDVLSILGGIYKQRGARVDGRLGGALHAWDGSLQTRHHDVARAAWQNVRLGLAAGLALMLIGTCLVVVFPWQVVLIASTMRTSPYKSAAAAAMCVLVFVFLVVPLGLSLAGLPFALLLSGAALLAWLFGIAATAVVVGRHVSRAPATLLPASAGGLLVLALAMAIPFVGPVVVTATGLLGAGALAVALLERATPAAPLG